MCIRDRLKEEVFAPERRIGLAKAGLPSISILLNSTLEDSSLIVKVFISLSPFRAFRLTVNVPPGTTSASPVRYPCLLYTSVKNKLNVFMNWAWNYLSLDPSLRLLIRPKPVRQEKEGSPWK